ncbi:MAG: LysE family transporter [Azoarcus sp.]|jgi:threonine/homoserine/homoserine lactone efflux protein|nr:LysE family translocator [Azoarcus sp.]MDD2875128.1 LysE family transporter [Azoarcus sp.]MDX9838696.1 LysE family transporter [Azoarcus sp.]
MLIKGLVLGFSIAAPVGPIGLLCLRRGLEKGFWAAFSSGLGAATADACYGMLGAFGLAAVSALLIGQSDVLRLFGGLFLLWLAWQTWRSMPAPQAAEGRRGGLWKGYLTTMLLTLSNPVTILSFAAIFAGLGLPHGNVEQGLVLVLGVFLGSALWWSMLAALAKTVATRVGVSGLRWINRVSALVLAGFGAWSLLGLVRVLP